MGAPASGGADQRAEMVPGPPSAVKLLGAAGFTASTAGDEEPVRPNPFPHRASTV